MRTADLIVGTVNVHAVSDPEVVKDWLVERYLQHEPDLVALQELTPRHIRAFREIPGYRLQVDRDEPGSAETGWLVRDTLDLRTSAPVSVRMTANGWFGWRVQRQHTPRFMAHLDLHVQGIVLSFGSVHTPPGVDCTPNGLTGPKDRRRAWRQYMKSLRLWVKNWTESRFVLIGDWNERPSVEAKWSPRWLARKVGAKTWGNGSIDYPMTKGVKVVRTWTFQGPKGLDHNPHIFWLDIL